MHSVRKDLVIAALVVLVACVNGEDCVSSENPITCRGVNLLSKALNQVITNHDDTLKILPGLEIVQNENVNKVNKDNVERSMPENETILTRFGKYLQTHDLKIKFSDIVGKTDLQEVVNSAFTSDDPAIAEGEKKIKCIVCFFE